jgi:uncharacterized membrane protein YdjX (TVP38/TMEM64 family)
VKTFFENDDSSKPKLSIILLLLVVVGVCGLSFLWRFTPLGGLIETEKILSSGRLFESSIWDCLSVIIAYTVAGLISFPIVVLIPATATVFGVTDGFTYSLIALFVNATVLYFMGYNFNNKTFEILDKKRIGWVSQKLSKHSFMTVVILRLLPAAPYTLVNLLAGAFKVPFVKYALGTIIGIAPSVLIMTLAGGQLKKAVINLVSQNILIAFVLSAVMFMLFIKLWKQFSFSRNKNDVTLS